MKTRATGTRRLRIGELAKATGLTVRTLHHYESIGLLTPPARTDGRQRSYGDQDVQRLYRICALRDLGLSLASIKQTLARDHGALSELLQAHRARLRLELERLERLRMLLDHACAQAAGDPSTEALLATIEAMSRVTRRAEARHDEGRQAGENEAAWRALGRRLRACMAAGESPAGPRARAVARAALARIDAFAGGDEATLAALAHLRKNAPPRDLAGWDPPLMRYLDQALSSLKEQEEKKKHAERTDRKRGRTGKAGHRVGGKR